MKKYQKVLGWLGKALKIIIVILTAVAGWFTGENLQDKWKADQAANRIATTWCLDNGGRTATIDGLTDCFQLTEVMLESKTFRAQSRECTRVPTQAYIKAPGNNTLYFCYLFQRITKEN